MPEVESAVDCSSVVESEVGWTSTAGVSGVVGSTVGVSVGVVSEAYSGATALIGTRVIHQI